MALITEDHLEQQCLEWFQELGYTHIFAPQLDSDGTSPERLRGLKPRFRSGSSP